MKVGHRIETTGVHACDFAWGVADILGRHNIGRPEQVGQTDQYKMFQTLGHTLTEGHAFCPVTFFESQKTAADLFNGGFPGNGLPFAFTPGADPSQRGFQTFGVVQAIRQGLGLGADVSPVQIAPGIALDLDDPVVCDTHLQGAAAVVHPGTVRFYPFQFIGIVLYSGFHIFNRLLC